MTRRPWLIAFVVIALLIPGERLLAIGRGGGGGFRGGGGGFQGGGARPSMGSRPNMSRPPTSMPHLGGGSHASPSRPGSGLPQSRPNFNRPQSRPQMSRPSGGLKPSTLPGNRGSGLPTSGLNDRPGGSTLTDRPNTSLPGISGHVDGSRLNGLDRSNLGGGRDFGNRPNAGDRFGGLDRPNPGNRSGNGDRPNLSGRLGGDHPTPGNLGDFLGMDKPLRPDTQPGGRFSAQSGIADRFGLGNRPGAGDRLRPDDPLGPDGDGGRPGDRLRPENRPGPDNRPGSDNGLRPNDRLRPDNRFGPDDRFRQDNRPDRGDRWANHGIINNRPSWANINNSTNIDIHNRWNNAFNRPGDPDWRNRPDDRRDYWRGWGDGVRDSWRYYNRHDNWFGNDWWSTHHVPPGGWHYHDWNNYHPWGYWWTAPTWGALTGWFAWSAPANTWAQPVYYDYGSGGNVIYQDNSVYVGGEQVATADQFAQSAMDLATVDPPESEEQAANEEWMPLGTFAVSTNEKDIEPNLTLQLAVSKSGIISGTLYNVATDQTQMVQGQVDKQTQRVAFRIGENQDVVVETGLYNLTQDDVPALVHFGTERTENYLLVRLEQPESDAS